tara:strand:+ start:2150 stop:2644 length:495 start_codon:yes stop_codon:yes gene_type:complete
MTKRKNTNDNDNNDAKRIGVSPGNPPQTINTNNLFQEPPIEPLTPPFHNSITNSPISDLSSSPDIQMDVMSPMSLENDYQEEEVGVPLTRQQGAVDAYAELEEMNRQMREIQEELRRRSGQQGGKKRKKTNRKKSLKKNRKTKRKKSLKKHRKTKRRYKKQGHK